MFVPLDRRLPGGESRPGQKKGLVISDLHLFARRSDGETRLAEVSRALKTADVLVLNGDTFDFRWSRLPSEEATIAAAVQWLEALAAEFDGREIHYLLGNHDCLGAFRARLEDFARRHPVLRCHEHRLRLGRALFLHGDCANRKMDAARLSEFRDAWSRDRPRGRMNAALYDATDALGFSRQFHRLYFPPRRSVRRVAHHLDRVMPAWRDEVDDCCFGHTHRPFRDHSLDGVRFHNTGSAIRGMEFQPLTFFIDASP